MAKTVVDVLGRERADKLREELGMIVDCVGVTEEELVVKRYIRVDLMIGNRKIVEHTDDETGMLVRVLKEEILELKDTLMQMLYSGDHSLGIVFNRYMSRDKIELNHETYIKLMKADSTMEGWLNSILEKEAEEVSGIDMRV